MADPRLESTVKDIRDTIADWSKTHSSKSKGYGPRALIIMAYFGVDLQETDSGEYFWTYSPFIAEHLHREALSNWDTFRMYSDIVASKIRCGVQLLKIERDFAARVLSGELKSPKMPKANKMEDNFSRNLLILAAVDWLVEDHGLNRFPSNVPTSGKEDASTLVSEAFCQCGHHEVTPSAVKGVLQNKKLLSWVEKLERARQKPGRIVGFLMCQDTLRDNQKAQALYAKLSGFSRQ